MSETVLAFVADLHIASHRSQGGPWQGGVNERGRMTIECLRRALAAADEAEAVTFNMLGDVFDTVRPEPQLIAATQRAMNEHRTLPKRIIKGNHDENSSELGDHALGPLGELRDVEVYERPHLERLEYNDMVAMPRVEVFHVPFETGPASQWIPERVAALAAESHPDAARILALHVGIHDKGLRDANFWAEKANDAVSAELLAGVCRDHGIRIALAGNWHGRNVMEYTHPPLPSGQDRVILVQVGTLCPTGWDNPDYWGYGSVALVAVQDDGRVSVDFREVPGPRFVNVSSEVELEDAYDRAHQQGCPLFVRWVCQPSDVAGARHALTRAREAGTIAGWDVSVDKKETALQAREAAKAAQSTTTLQGVLSAFVSKMPLPEGVDRDRVFALADGYLR